MMTRLHHLSAIGIPVVAMLIVATSVVSGRGDPQKQVKIDAAGAKAAAESFVGGPMKNATVTGPIYGALHNAWQVSNAQVDLYVDAFNGKPLIIMMKGMDRGVGPAIPAATAIEKAAAFLSQHGVGIPAVDAVATLVDHGAFQAYEVTWQARSAKALAPDVRTVKIDAATGHVIGMLDDERPYAPAPDPVVSQDSAADLAREAAGMPGAAVASSVLRIAFDSAGNQQLVWSIAIQAASGPVINAAFVDVDAITGVAVVTGRG